MHVWTPYTKLLHADHIKYSMTFAHAASPGPLWCAWHAKDGVGNGGGPMCPNTWKSIKGRGTRTNIARLRKSQIWYTIGLSSSHPQPKKKNLWSLGKENFLESSRHTVIFKVFDPYDPMLNATLLDFPRTIDSQWALYMRTCSDSM